MLGAFTEERHMVSGSVVRRAAGEVFGRNIQPRWLPWAGVCVTLAFGAGAVATGLGASHRYDELRASCGRTVEGCAQSDIDQVKSRALTANLL